MWPSFVDSIVKSWALYYDESKIMSQWNRKATLRWPTFGDYREISMSAPFQRTSFCCHLRYRNKKLSWWYYNGHFKWLSLKFTMWFHCKNTWWFVTKKQSRWLLCGVTNRRPPENETHERQHISVHYSECDTFVTSRRRHINWLHY